MKLTEKFTHGGTVGAIRHTAKRNRENITVALAGNPNVGKSSVFNALTGMHQHTGNWAGKTVATAVGICHGEKRDYTLVDLPGTYSLSARSAEEEVARDFLFSNRAYAVIVVCDATCIERNMHLVLQVLEAAQRVIVCVNLMDEARRKGIEPNLEKLSERLKVPVIGTCAHKKSTLKSLVAALDLISDDTPNHYTVHYPDKIESAIKFVETALEETGESSFKRRSKAVGILTNNAQYDDEQIKNVVSAANVFSEKEGLHIGGIGEEISAYTVNCAEKICDGIRDGKSGYRTADRKLDRIFTGKFTAYPVMLALLAAVLWITVTGANYPSQWLSALFAIIEEKLSKLFTEINAPPFAHGILIEGVWRTLSAVVSVMLPPMAIFFPLFTLLEDSGYLPRIAYNLDRPFKKCNACGKQALTMCMGFGCNAAGVVGCRIIDSPRERLLAVLTNSLVPCNGRFPTLIAIITVFFVKCDGVFASALSSLILTGVILLGIIATFAATKILSVTLLKGYPSAFTLELPPYRRPQIWRVTVRSVFDRTLFVLGRSVAVAAPAGLLLWLCANTKMGSSSILSHCCDFLDPFAKLLGLDGVLLTAFILGFPANETVLPIAAMGYLAQGSLETLNGLNDMRILFTSNGWTPVTALCTLIFMLFHWPCSTTLITVKKETGKTRWAIVAAAIPTIIGMLLCFTVKLVSTFII